jgi:hypothetical protein
METNLKEKNKRWVKLEKKNVILQLIRNKKK